jgi:hypothetical protein
VPGASSRNKKAEMLVEELGTDVARFTQQGQVVIAGDWNCRVGNLASVTERTCFSRQNVTKKTDARGRRIVEL